MSFAQIFYGIFVPLIIFSISFITTILLYKKFSKEIREKK